MSHVGCRIVVVDDDQQMLEMLKDYLESQQCKVKDFSSARAAFGAISQKHDLFGDGSAPDLIITDLNMPEMDGIELIQNLKRLDNDLPVVLITAHASIESAVEATRRGAFSYVVKPFKLSEFIITVDRAISHGKLARENSILKSQVTQSFKKGNIIGKSPAIRQVFDLIDRVAKATANIFVTGESGTGKELVARAIHEESPRSQKQFVAINCAAIPENLLESELFGHVKGSFTGAVADKVGLFEEAHGGTLFLDEIGDLNLPLQAKLLRVLQDKEIRPIGSTKSKKIDVRLITATHKDLRAAVKAGEFREDLYYRLSVIPVALPPLRDRTEDIPILAHHFLKKYSAINGSPVEGFTSAAMEKLLRSPFPGNVRELENLIERAVVLATGAQLGVADVSFEAEGGGEGVLADSASDWPTLSELEKRYILAVLEKVGGKKEKAADILGINRRTLYRKELEYSGQEHSQ